MAPTKVVSMAMMVLATFGVLANASPIVEQRDGCVYTCGDNCYAQADIDAAVDKGYSLYQSGSTLGRDKYPHKYNDYEGFDFPTDAPWYEFPILASTAVYSGGSPGADRVIFDTQGAFDSVITHTGASGDNFVACTQ